LLNLKIANDIKKYGIQQKVNYIYFNSNDLIKYNLELEDIKNLIKEKNRTRDVVLKYENEN
jgi:multidrug efflux pump subunit AcrB